MELRIIIPSYTLTEYMGRLPFPSPGELPDPGTEPSSPALHKDSLLMSHWGSPKERRIM